MSVMSDLVQEAQWLIPSGCRENYPFRSVCAEYDSFHLIFLNMIKRRIHDGLLGFKSITPKKT